MANGSHQPQLSRTLILKLQTTCGNRAVQRLVERRTTVGEDAVAETGPPAPQRSWLARLFGKLFGDGT
jgi:hypothetical protein